MTLESKRPLSPPDHAGAAVPVKAYSVNNLVTTATCCVMQQAFEKIFVRFLGNRRPGLGVTTIHPNCGCSLRSDETAACRHEKLNKNLSGGKDDIAVWTYLKRRKRYLRHRNAFEGNRRKPLVHCSIQLSYRTCALAGFEPATDELCEGLVPCATSKCRYKSNDGRWIPVHVAACNT